MKGYSEFFKGKKITLMGLGLLGRGVGDAEFLARCGAEVLVTDKKSEGELKESVEQLKKYPNITFHLGGHDEKDFTSADMVIKAAGVPLDSPYIAAAKKAGVPVYMSTALFAKYAMDGGANVIGVTGTRGKSTIAHMIHHVLIRANKKVVLGGNIRGKSTLAMLPAITADDIVVLELDSWQLQGFGDLHISPQVAVFTNLMPDHMNYYGGDMEKYFSDKANIFRYQKKSDALIIGPTLKDKVKGAVAAPISAEWTLKIPGEHNRENASLTAAALRALGVSELDIKSGLESFEGVEGRLQFVRQINGVQIYNDNNATTPEATIAALRALGGNVVLIAGGADKGLDTAELISEIERSCKKVLLLAGTGTDKIKARLPSATVYDSLADALNAAFGIVSPGDVLLFSPAFASFGMFKNEYDRNDQFLALVQKLA